MMATFFFFSIDYQAGPTDIDEIGQCWENFWHTKSKTVAALLILA